ncbi:hypothetical protein Hanom_Chr14g01255621 [Helianthus anomalus]
MIQVSRCEWVGVVLVGGLNLITLIDNGVGYKVLAVDGWWSLAAVTVDGRW